MQSQNIFQKANRRHNYTETAAEDNNGVFGDRALARGLSEPLSISALILVRTVPSVSLPDDDVDDDVAANTTGINPDTDVEADDDDEILDVGVEAALLVLLMLAL